MARHLYEMAADCVMAHLLIQDATRAPQLFARSARVYVNYAAAEVEKHATFVLNFDAGSLSDYRK